MHIQEYIKGFVDTKKDVPDYESMLDVILADKVFVKQMNKKSMWLALGEPGYSVGGFTNIGYRLSRAKAFNNLSILVKKYQSGALELNVFGLLPVLIESMGECQHGEKTKALECIEALVLSGLNEVNGFAGHKGFEEFCSWQDLWNPVIRAALLKGGIEALELLKRHGIGVGGVSNKTDLSEALDPSSVLTWLSKEQALSELSYQQLLYKGLLNKKQEVLQWFLVNKPTIEYDKRIMGLCIDTALIQNLPEDAISGLCEYFVQITKKNGLGLDFFNQVCGEYRHPRTFWLSVFSKIDADLLLKASQVVIQKIKEGVGLNVSELDGLKAWDKSQACFGFLDPRISGGLIEVLIRIKEEEVLSDLIDKRIAVGKQSKGDQNDQKEENKIMGKGFRI